MSRLAPAGPVYQAGTLSGNPLACAAGLATLRLRRRRGLPQLDEPAARSGRLVADSADRRRGAAPAARTRATCSRSSSPTPTSSTTTPPSTQDVAAFKAFFHAMLAAGVYLPPSAFESWFVSAALDDAALRADRRGPAAGARSAAAAGRRKTHEHTTVVHRAAARRGVQPRPDPVRAAARLPPVRAGRQMAKAAAEALADRDVTYVVASPLERAQETAEPIAAQFGLEVGIDMRLIESRQRVRGQEGLGRRRIVPQPPQLVGAARPDHARRGARRTWSIAQRMFAALHAARVAAEGHEAVCVSHQLPIWTLRRYVERQAALARPAPPAVRPGQPHLVPLRGRQGRRHRLPGAGRPPDRDVAAAPGTPRGPDRAPARRPPRRRPRRRRR